MAERRPKMRFLPVWSMLAVATAMLVAGLSWLPAGSAPEATWHFGADRATVQPFDQVPMYDSMALTVDLPFAGYVYVASFDHRQGTVAYFPTDYLGTDYKDHATGRMNAFAAGRHELPGPWDGKQQAWFVPNVQETLSLCVVVSDAPILQLEETLRLVMQIGNTAFPDRSMGRYMPRAGESKLLGRHRLPHDALRAAQDQAGSVEAGPMVPWSGHPGIFVKVLNIVPGRPRPGATTPSNPFRQRLETMVQDKLQPK